MLQRRHGSGSHRIIPNLALAVLLVTVLAGCAVPVATPDVPQPTAMTALSTAPATLPAPQPPTLTPTAPAPTAEPTATMANPASDGSDGLRLTILHTNDVSGWVDPCG